MPISISFISSINRGRKLHVAFMATVLLLVVLTMLQDYIRARVQQTGYYVSESFLFSSFWWLFAPLWYAQYKWFKLTTKPLPFLADKPAFRMPLLMILPVGMHLILFPSLVWGISALFFEHTFRFERTLSYTISEHLYLLFALYSLPVLYAWLIGVKKEAAANPNDGATEEAISSHPVLYPDTLWVDAGNNAKIAVSVSELTCCTANSPYVNLHFPGKKYLYPSTLKALEEQLDPGRFIRIHKTTLVNIEYVASIRSRQNGDYDITLMNNLGLRVSRHYAAHFKTAMEAFSLGLN